MLGYSKLDIQEIMEGLIGLEGTEMEVYRINRAIDFFDGLLTEGYAD
jgi:hypothetical protein